MEWIMNAMVVISLVIIHVTGVAATQNSDIIGIVVAGCASFVLICTIIGILIGWCNWTTWFNNWMRRRGKVRMPKAYFIKKEEAMRRLISGSPASQVSVPNGNLTPINPDRDVAVTNQMTNQTKHATTNNHAAFVNHVPSANGTAIPIPNKTAKIQTSKRYVQGWPQGNTVFTNRIYEEKDATLELGEEGDDEFKIETEVVDNETLDVGPYKHDHSKEVPIKGDVYPDPYLYTTVDNLKKTNKSGLGNSAKPGRTSAKVTKNMDAEYSTPGEVKTTKFEEGLLYL